MYNILCFSLNGSKYLFYTNGNKIKLGRLNGKTVDRVQSGDKKVLKEIIEILCSSDMDKQALFSKNISILDHDINGINYDTNKVIVLSFTNNKKSVFLDNCKSFEVAKKSRNGWIPFFAVLVTSLLVVFGILFTSVVNGSKNSYKSSSKKELLSKYTVDSDINVEHKVISIHGNGMTNFYDDFVTFYVPYSVYNSYKDDGIDYYNFYGFDLKIYRKNDYYVDSLNKYYDEFPYSDISLSDILSKYNVENSMDLIYQCLLNMDNNVGVYSTDDQIIEKFVFDYLRNVVPYSSDSSINKVIFFTGEKYGYAQFIDDTINIVLKDGNDRIKMVFSNFSNGMLSDREIVELVYSLKINS